MKTIKVNASRSYEILVEDGLLDHVGKQCAGVLRGKRVLLLTDETVGALYRERVQQSLEHGGFAVHVMTVASGEGSKSATTYWQVVSCLAENRFTRSDAVIALGGGVVGDLGGFCAATYLRGIAFVQIPTTLLACVDSSVGGKTAINLPEGKNLLGAFYQPWLVLCDPAVLKTLTPAIYADGMAEVIKYGMIRDRVLFEALEQETISDVDMICRCVAIKRDIVERDERDVGCRQLLNFGHTVGHAVEKCSGFAISHGSAVAIGMAYLSRALVARGQMLPEDCHRLLALLAARGLPTSCNLAPQALYEAALSDKKRADETLALITVPTIGEGQIETIPVPALARYIEQGAAQ